MPIHRTKNSLTENEIADFKLIKSREEFLDKEMAEVGLLELQIKLRKESNENFYKETVNLRKQLAKYIKEKYGDGSIDLDKGKFIPSK